MQYRTFSDQESDQYPIALLAPKLEADGVQKEYLDESCILPEQLIAYKLYTAGKTTKAEARKAYLDELLPILHDLGTNYLLVTDSDYFKTLTGVKKSDAYIGYVLPNTYPKTAAGRFNVIFIPNFRQVFYNPGPTRAKIKLALEALQNHRLGSYSEPGHDVLHFAEYPSEVADIAAWLHKLIEMRVPLTADIEGFSLKHYDAGIGTISFAWNKHEGIAFPVDMGPDGKAVRRLLKKFFIELKENLTWHKISYDVTVLIYQLFMKDILDQKGMLEGLEVMLSNWDCTRLISYLATNSCAGNNLSLKHLAQEHTGNYAVEEITDITKIPMPELLEYNLIDACGTWFVKDKYEPIMDAENQREFYETIFKPAMWDIIQMQLTGMPVDMEEVAKARIIIDQDRNDAILRMRSHMLLKEFEERLNLAWVEKKNATLKKKRVSMADAKEVFNPNSPPQLQGLFYEFLGLPVIEKTKSKQPSTKAEVLEKLKAYTEDQDIRDLIDAFLDFKAVDKIYGTFIPALENAQLGPDGWHYLFGSFNLGGTVSGRLSSSEPNLQNLPSKGTKYAKLIKGCFKAPPGYVMIGLDFNSLEDMISALTTRDPNKLKVYTDGFDGHCLRAYSYFAERMSDNLDPTDPESINSIADMYPELRQDSKTPTFALTYQGTYMTLIAKCGFSKAVAMQIEERYHELYKVSDQWVAAKLDEASKTGYITAAFGLRLRTPLLAQVIRGNSATPYEAEAEGRTAGNALGQSWCLLNTRAASEFMQTVRAGQHRLDIRKICQIHDAQYYVIPDDINILLYVNKNLVKAVKWQEHPDIQHDQVKLGGNLAIFHPSWNEEIDLPNDATDEIVRSRVQEKLQKMKGAA